MIFKIYKYFDRGKVPKRSIQGENVDGLKAFLYEISERTPLE